MDGVGKEIVEVRKGFGIGKFGRERRVGAELIHYSSQGFRLDHRKRLEMERPWKVDWKRIRGRKDTWS